MFENIEVLLCSNSPRRKELLQSICPDFAILKVPSFDESFPDSLLNNPGKVVEHIALKKCDVARSFETDTEKMIITADTIVWLDNKVYGKPKDREDAIEMLCSFSGRTHVVSTGYAVSFRGITIVGHQDTKVTFASLADKDIEYYVDTFKPFDKAGAYGIQEWIGMVGITGIEGDYYNVMGLPVCSLRQAMMRIIQ